jgi:hypothetical protein
MCEPGALPWRPNSTASLVDVYHRYDIPLVGIVEDDDTQYLFQCLAGHADDVSVWAYTPVTEREQEVLEEADPEFLVQVQMGFSRGRPVEVAIATEDDGVLLSIQSFALEDTTRISELLAAAIRADHRARAKLEASLSHLAGKSPAELRVSDSVRDTYVGDWHPLALV